GGAAVGAQDRAAHDRPVAGLARLREARAKRRAEAVVRAEDVRVRRPTVRRGGPGAPGDERPAQGDAAAQERSTGRRRTGVARRLACSGMSWPRSRQRVTPSRARLAKAPGVMRKT